MWYVYSRTLKVKKKKSSCSLFVVPFHLGTRDIQIQSSEYSNIPDLHLLLFPVSFQLTIFNRWPFFSLCACQCVHNENPWAVITYIFQILQSQNFRMTSRIRPPFFFSVFKEKSLKRAFFYLGLIKYQGAIRCCFFFFCISILPFKWQQMWPPLLSAFLEIEYELT